MNKSICFYFQVHQPFRIEKKSLFEDEENHDLSFEGLDDFKNHQIFEKVSQKCYLPMTNLLLELLDRHPEFRCSFSLSGVFLEQCETYGDIGDAVLSNFQKLAATGQVEFLAETYHHSLSFLHSKLEFAEQIQLHNEKIYKLLGVKPRIFRNTELIYSDELAAFVRHLGFDAVLAEGWHTALPYDHPNHVWTAKKVKLHAHDVKIAKQFSPVNLFGFRKKISSDIKVLAKNYKLSDDIAFRFGNKEWEEHPLSTEKFAYWVSTAMGETINLFMDFETFGEHQWEDTGIFDFMRHLPSVLLDRGIGFKTPSETIRDYEPQGEFSSAQYVSWADENRDISAWLDNDLQRSAFEEVINLEKKLHKHKRSRSPEVQKLWDDFRKLQTSDHFYYMSTKYWADGDVHTYFSPYGSPYDAFINYMVVLDLLKRRMGKLNIR
jgi:alpha-amylase